MKYLAILAAIIFTASVTPAQLTLSKDDKKILSDFEMRAGRYTKMRDIVLRRLPKLPKDATPEQIILNKTHLREGVQKARVNARQGDLFTQSATALIRSIIKQEFKGYEGAEIRQTVLEADQKGVPLKVNALYPETKELVEMSPALLLALPQLPKQLRYRYIGRSLAILDRDNGLIIDFMTDALP